MRLIDITIEDVTTLVGLLTIEQKLEIVGVEFIPDCTFNPIQDINDNWVISTQEMIQCINPNFLWVKDLELITYEPKQYPLP
jgi:hypothetical protein